MRDHTLQAGFARGFEVAAGVAVPAIVVVLVVVRPRQASHLADSGDEPDLVSRVRKLST